MGIQFFFLGLPALPRGPQALVAGGVVSPFAGCTLPSALSLGLRCPVIMPGTNLSGFLLTRLLLAVMLLLLLAVQRQRQRKKGGQKRKVLVFICLACSPLCCQDRDRESSAKSPNTCGR